MPTRAGTRSDEAAGGEDLRNDRARRDTPSPTPDGWVGFGLDDADSVELKILLAGHPDDAAALMTGRRSPRWRTRTMHLLDTPDLALARSGLEMRLRRRPRGRHDLTVRARHPWAGSAPRRPEGGRVELDVLPGSAWRTTQLRRTLDAELTTAWLAGRVTPGRLMSDDQRAWTREYLGAERAATTARTLTVHGPLTVHRLRVPSARFPVARARLEHCRYPSGRGLVEFSARCAPDRAPQVAEELTAFLHRHGLALAAEQRTKTAVWVDDLVRHH